jgi:hypothetical protein
VLAVPSLCEFYPGICLTTEEKARKNLSQDSRRIQSVHITKTPTHYKTYTPMFFYSENNIDIVFLIIYCIFKFYEMKVLELNFPLSNEISKLTL